MDPPKCWPMLLRPIRPMLRRSRNTNSPAAPQSTTNATAKHLPCMRCAFRMQAAPTARTPFTARMAGPKQTSAPALLQTTIACCSGRAISSSMQLSRRLSPLAASEMRELAARIPTPPGNRSMMPPILANLPQHWLDPQTTHYAEGPAGYAGGGGVLPPELVGFDRGAEAATASYSSVFWPCNAHRHRLPHAADGGGDGDEDS